MGNPRINEFEMTEEIDDIYADLKAFKARTNEELRRARRYATFVSLIAVDLTHIEDEDEIENFNGFDEFVSSFRRLVRSSIRETDVLGASLNRKIYILLIDTPSEGAQVLSQRLQSTVRYFMCHNIKSPLKWRAPMKHYSFPQTNGQECDLRSLLDEMD